MMYYSTTHADVAESFFLGLSCLVGGDQFFILVSKTDASPKTQSYIAITAVLVSLYMSFVLYDEYNRSLFDVTHVLYLVLLVIWGLILYQNVKNPFVTTYYILMIGMVMTFLVIISCVHYSHQQGLLPSFLSGMLCARLLPTILWIFVHQKKPESKSNLSSLSARLAFFRLVFGIISMILKFTSGNLDFSEIRLLRGYYDDWLTVRYYALKNTLKHFNKIFIRSDYYVQGSVIRSAIFLLFFSSIILYLGLPPIVHKYCHIYSQHLNSRIDVMKTLSHLLGVALGTKYPVSKTTNSYYFGAICFVYAAYVLGSPIVNDYFKFTSPIFLYTVVNLTGFILGYVWSYSLLIIKKVFFLKTCVYEEKTSSTCCGDKIESQCSCKTEPILKSINSGNSDKMFRCSKLVYSQKRLKYSQSGKCAILLLIGCDNTSTCPQRSDSNCSPGCKGDCCVKIIGKYKVDAVTVSSCEECQLTVRLEGDCVDPDKCTTFSCSNGKCDCNNGNCCCICVKCCKSDCANSECKCCIHVCKGNGGTCKCNCNNTTSNGDGVRVFLCFKNNDKCCIRELRPNLSKEFISDLKIQNQFDIKSIFIFDCCHVDVTVDIQCSMKNNFFRATPINYPKKTTGPISLMLMRDGTECCKSPKTQSCCKNSDLVTVCVKYDGTEKNCEVKCSCEGTTGCCCNGRLRCPCCTCGDGKCCCCVTCELSVNKLSAFYQRIEPVRVKLVLILWFFFLIFLMIEISIFSKIKNKRLKYYQFFPITSFETVYSFVDNNDMNSMHEVLKRLKSAHQGIFLQLFGEKDKKTDLDLMFQLCKCALDPCSLNTLRHYVLSKSSMLISSPHYINRRLNLELVKWSYCVGFVYTYIMLMFFRIQEYFLKWERVWRMEYLNYTRIISKKFNNLTQKSKSSISLMCEKGVDHKTTLYTDKSKKGGWDCSHDELDIHANLNERETEMNKSPPHRLDLRLMFYLERWKHRVEIIKFWGENETNVYDWTGLIKEYPKIRTWFFKFLPHIQRASHEFIIPLEELNRGTEILQNKPIHLIS